LSPVPGSGLFATGWRRSGCALRAGGAAAGKTLTSPTSAVLLPYVALRLSRAACLGCLPISPLPYLPNNSCYCAITCSTTGSCADQAGKAEPIAAQHSWNSPHWYSSAFMLNAPRHSDHHACPARGYTALRLPDDGPMLPSSLPLMACLALFPGLWRRVMDPRAAVWQTE